MLSIVCSIYLQVDKHVDVCVCTHMLMKICDHAHGATIMRLWDRTNESPNPEIRILTLWTAFAVTTSVVAAAVAAAAMVARGGSGGSTTSTRVAPTTDVRRRTPTLPSQPSRTARALISSRFTDANTNGREVEAPDRHHHQRERDFVLDPVREMAVVAARSVASSLEGLADVAGVATSWRSSGNADTSCDSSAVILSGHRNLGWDTESTNLLARFVLYPFLFADH